MPNHYYVGDLLLTIGISGPSRVRTKLFELAVVPALAPHPVQMHCQLAGHRHLRDLAPTSHGEVEELTAPLWLSAYRDLGCFDQQIAKQRVALLADVPQSATIAAGFFRRHQTHIARNLLAAVKAFRSSNHQLQARLQALVAYEVDIFIEGKHRIPLSKKATGYDSAGLHAKRRASSTEG